MFFKFFPNGVNKTSAPLNYNDVISSFPSFQKKNYDELNIGYLSYGGMMAGMNLAYKNKSSIDAEPAQLKDF